MAWAQDGTGYGKKSMWSWLGGASGSRLWVPTLNPEPSGPQACGSRVLRSVPDILSIATETRCSFLPLGCF